MKQRDLHSDGELVYFAGTDPRQRGRPLPGAETNRVGTPREQWEAELLDSDLQAWYAYQIARPF